MLSNPLRTTPLSVRISGSFFSGLLHCSGTALMAVLLALPAMDGGSLVTIADAMMSSDYRPDWYSLGLHLGLALCSWALICLSFSFVRQRRKSSRRIIRLSRGSVMVETLVVIVPFLALTSGIAQLGILNVASVLGHVAAYQGARAAWVWAPEIGSGGRISASPDFVRNRARIAVAMVMAPTAPSAYLTSPAGDDALDEVRGMMTAHFTPGLNGSEAGKALASAFLFTNSAQSTSEELRYHDAFDSQSFGSRAARKITYAYLALDDFELINNSTAVGVRFSYKMNIVFPWFSYIWGQPGQVGMRVGRFANINRRYVQRPQVAL
jgi:hypothetical protein